MSERRDSPAVIGASALAPREYEYLRQRARGCSQKQIAAAWGITLQMVKLYGQQGRRKLGANGDAQAFTALGWLRVPR